MVGGVCYRERLVIAFVRFFPPYLTCCIVVLDFLCVCHHREREHRNLSSSPSGTSLDEIEENDDSSFEDMSDDDDANVEKKEYAIGDDETILALAGAPSDSGSTDRISVATLQLVRPNLFLQREIGESGCVLLKSEYTILNSYWRNSDSLQFLQRNLEDAPYLNTLLGQPQSRCRNIDHDINIRCEGLETFVSTGHVDIGTSNSSFYLFHQLLVLSVVPFEGSICAVFLFSSIDVIRFSLGDRFYLLCG